MVRGIVVYGSRIVCKVVGERGTLEAYVVEVVAGQVRRAQRRSGVVAGLDGVIGVVGIVLGRVAREIETRQR